MAIKATLSAALLATLIALATATTFTTTVVTDDETNNGYGYGQCSQQVQGRQFQACQRFLRQSGGPYNAAAEEEEEADEEALIELAGNPQQQYFHECCQELKQMDRRQCGCEAIRHAVRQAQQGTGTYRTGQSQQIYQRARALPRRCGLRQQQCRFSAVFA